MKAPPEIRIGISGWTYPPWRGVFYPKDLPQKRELDYASRQLPTIEINGSFYSLQRPRTYVGWYSQTPDGFVFSVKATRFITHLRRLLEIEKPLANFMASGLLALKEKLGPVLWQFPPNMKYDHDRFARFLDLLPGDTRSAARLARKHESWMKGRSFTEVDSNRPMRHAVEIRNSSFENAEFIQLLKDHEVALVFSDAPKKWPVIHELTSDHIYLRLHGEKELYASGYDDEALDTWARRIRAWTCGKNPLDSKRLLREKGDHRLRDAYVYFDNDAKVRAPFDAVSLLERLTDFRPTYPMHWPSKETIEETIRRAA